MFRRSYKRRLRRFNSNVYFSFPVLFSISLILGFAFFPVVSSWLFLLYFLIHDFDYIVCVSSCFNFKIYYERGFLVYDYYA